VSDWYENLATEDFSKARTKELLQRISGLLGSEEEDRLLSLEEVKSILRPGSETYEGIQAVPIDLIVGSEGRYRDFNRHFLPRQDHLKSRWVHVDMAQYADVPLPPVRLYKIGGVYFVRDGNHRVSVAKMKGQTSIDAEVSSLDSEVELKPGMTIEQLKREVLSHEKRNFYLQTHYGEITGDANLDFTSPGRYEEILEHILVHKYFINQNSPKEIPLQEAIRSWYDKVYSPIIACISELGLLERFPGRTASDLYVYIVKYWDELKKKYGLSFPVEEAARDYGELYGSARPGPFKEACRKMASGIKRILGIIGGLLTRKD